MKTSYLVSRLLMHRKKLE